MTQTNRQLILRSRPKGLLAPSDLQLVETPLPSLAEGQALVRWRYLSIDPTVRMWMADVLINSEMQKAVDSPANHREVSSPPDSVRA